MISLADKIRAGLDCIAERYDDTFDPAGEPTVAYVRHCASYYRSAAALMTNPGHLLAEADDLDALADEFESVIARELGIETKE